MKQWVRLDAVESRELLSRQGRRSVGVHAFTRRICHWAYCARCGLVLLRNVRTRAAMAAACITYEDD